MEHDNVSKLAIYILIQNFNILANIKESKTIILLYIYFSWIFSLLTWCNIPAEDTLFSALIEMAQSVIYTRASIMCLRFHHARRLHRYRLFGWVKKRVKVMVSVVVGGAGRGQRRRPIKRAMVCTSVIACPRMLVRVQSARRGNSCSPRLCVCGWQPLPLDPRHHCIDTPNMPQIIGGNKFIRIYILGIF